MTSILDPLPAAMLQSDATVGAQPTVEPVAISAQRLLQSRAM